MLIENVFVENLKGIVKTAYGDEDTPNLDWQTAIDVYLMSHPITEGMSEGRASQQRSYFLRYVQGKKFDKDGDEIRE